MEMNKIDLENFPTSSSARRMLDYVSGGFYDNSYVGKWIYQVMGLEYDRASEMVRDLPAQFFPETATWGLMYHEIKWGLPVRENLSHEERRRLIYLKRDYRAPMTPYRMEKYLEDVSVDEAHVTDINDMGERGGDQEWPHPNFFRVSLIKNGAIDAQDTGMIINRIKQSHTTCVMEIPRNCGTSLRNAVFFRQVIRPAAIKEAAV